LRDTSRIQTLKEAKEYLNYLDKGDIYNNLNNRIYVAQPSPRDTKLRPPVIPQSVLEERALHPLPEDTLERKIEHNPVKQLIDDNGGIGVFYIPDRGICLIKSTFY
jgi:hypothetical protein